MLIDRVDRYIQNHHLILPGETVIVGFSGGPDSLCLSHLLWRLSPRYGWRLVLAHFDHQLRGSDSRADAEFCRGWASTVGIPFFLAEMDINREATDKGESTELAARRCRYAFYRQVQQDTGAVKVALGHHRDDQAETVLMRLIRGTGIDGLGGMRPLREDGVIRPLLGESREAVLDYCDAEGLVPRVDHTNSEALYTRNALRLEVLPLLATRYNPRIAEALCRTAALAAEDSDCLNALAEKHLLDLGSRSPSGLELPLRRLRTLPVALVKRVLRQGVRSVSGTVENLESEHLDQLLKLLAGAHTGKHMVFCGTRFAVSYGTLVISPDKAVPGEEELIIPVEAGSYHFLDGMITLRLRTRQQWDQQLDCGPNCILVDGDTIQGSLRVRRRQDGDRLIPLGMNRFKKVKDVLMDSKVPRDQRSGIPVFCDDEKILWVAGIRMDERVRVRDGTKILVEIQWELCCSPSRNMLE